MNHNMKTKLASLILILSLTSCAITFDPVTGKATITADPVAVQILSDKAASEVTRVINEK